jgi:hypothetical protein
LVSWSLLLLAILATLAAVNGEQTTNQDIKNAVRQLQGQQQGGVNSAQLQQQGGLEATQPQQPLQQGAAADPARKPEASGPARLASKVGAGTKSLSASKRMGGDIRGRKMGVACLHVQQFGNSRQHSCSSPSSREQQLILHEHLLVAQAQHGWHTR